MINALVSIFLMLLAAICAAFYFSGKWRQRARAAERREALDRRAQGVQDDVLLDPAYRERVRRRFDRP